MLNYTIIECVIIYTKKGLPALAKTLHFFLEECYTLILSVYFYVVIANNNNIKKGLTLMVLCQMQGTSSVGCHRAV